MPALPGSMPVRYPARLARSVQALLCRWPGAFRSAELLFFPSVLTLVNFFSVVTCVFADIARLGNAGPAAAV